VRTAAALVLALAALPAAAQEGQFLTEAEAPAAVFPDADRFERHDVPATEALRQRVQHHLDGVTPSLWEDHWVVFDAWHGDARLGRAVLVEEIGKHRPISFVVGVRPDGKVADVAVMAYREAYGGQIGSRRFLAQYRGVGPAQPLRTAREVQNIAGATLSVDAANRAVRKARAVSAALAEGAS
jgi:transcriptional regulator of nitric oxide reductase